MYNYCAGELQMVRRTTEMQDMKVEQLQGQCHQIPYIDQKILHRMHVALYADGVGINDPQILICISESCVTFIMLKWEDI